MSQSRNRLFTMLCLGAAFLASTCAANAQDQEIRTWWSHDGSESIVASLDGFDKKSKIVTLKDENDEEVTVKITLLSRSDRSYVAKAVRRNSKLSKKNSVFKKSDVESTTERNVDEDRKSNNRSKRKSNPSSIFKRYGINWTKGIDNALAQAGEEGNRKPVMCFRVLGDLNGLM